MTARSLPCSVGLMVLYMAVFVALVGFSNAAPSTSFSIVLSDPIFPSSPFTAKLSFKNPLSDPGYIPFIDLVLPPDVTYTSIASSLGRTYAIDFDFEVDVDPESLTVSSLTFDNVTGCVDHPVAVNSTGLPLSVCLGNSWTLVVIQMSITSLSASVPADEVTANLALSQNAAKNIGQTYKLYGRGGFVLGGSTTISPSTDPSIVSSTSQNATGWYFNSFQTALAAVKIVYSPQDVSNWGSTYPITGIVSLQVAPGVTIKNASLSISYINQFVYVSSTSSFTGWTLTTSPAVGGTPKFGQLFNLTTSSSALTSAQFNFTSYVHKNDSNNVEIIPSATPWAIVPLNTTYVTLNFDILSSSNTSVRYTYTTNSSTLSVTNIKVDTSSSVITDNTPSGVTPRDGLTVTASIPISPFKPAELVYTASLADGHSLDTSRQITFTIPGSLVGTAQQTVTVNIPAANYALDNSTFSTNGQSAITVNITKLIIAQWGAQYWTSFTGPCALSIMIPTVVSGTVTSGTYLSSGDTVSTTSALYISSRKYWQSIGTTAMDFASLSVVISHVNGVSVGSKPLIIEDDLVTYRISYTALLSWKSLVYSVFFPYPLISGASITFDPLVQTSPTLNIPPVNVMRFGSSNTAAKPTMTFSQTTLSIDMGSFKQLGTTSTVFEYYVTLQVGPTIVYTDRAPLATPYNAIDNGVSRGSSANAIVGVPVLKLATVPFYFDSSTAYFSVTPCAYCSSSSSFFLTCLLSTFPAAQKTAIQTRVDYMNTNSTFSGVIWESVLRDLQGGDTINVVTIVSNFGSAGASDVYVKAVMPAGLQAPGGLLSGLNVCVRNLDGSLIPYLGTPFDTNGIRLLQNGVDHAITAANANNAKDVILISYTLQVKSSVSPGSIQTLQSSNCAYNGNNFSPCNSGRSNVYIIAPKLSTYTRYSSLTNSRGPNYIQVGQRFSVQASYQLPAGSYSQFTIVVAQVPTTAKLIFDSATVTQAGNITYTQVTPLITITNTGVGISGSALGNGDPGVISAVQPSATFNFGDVVVSDRSSAGVPFIVNISGTVLVDATNVAGTTFSITSTANNNATDGLTLSPLVFNIVEPSVTLTSSTLNVSTGDANDYVTVTSRLSFPGTGDVYQLQITSSFTVNTVDFVANSISLSPTQAFTVISQTARGFTISITNPINYGAATVDFIFRVRVASNVWAAASIPIVTTATWASLPSGGRTGTVSRTVTFTASSPTTTLTLVSSSITRSNPALLTVGQTATFSLAVRFPEGRTNITNFVFTPPLDTGTVTLLKPLSSSISAIGSRLSNTGLTVGTAGTVASDWKVSWTLPGTQTLVNTPDDVADSGDLITFLITVYPEDISANYDARPASLFSAAYVPNLINRGYQTTFRDPVTVATTSLVSTVCNHKTNLQGGCKLTTSVLVTTTSLPIVGFDGVLIVNATTLYQLNISSITISRTPSSGTTAATVRAGGSTSSFVVDIPIIDATTYNITFTSSISTDIEPATTVGFNTSVAWSSAPASLSPPSTRKYSSKSSLMFTSWTPTPTLNVQSTGLAMAVSNPTTLVPPGEITYLNLTLPVSEGKNALSATINLPNNLVFDSSGLLPAASVQFTGTGLNLTASRNFAVGTLANLTDTDSDGLMDQAIFNFGIVAAMDDDASIDASLVVMLSVRVKSTGPKQNDLLNISASIGYSQTNPLGNRFLWTSLRVTEPTALLNTTTIAPTTGDANDKIQSTILLRSSTTMATNLYNLTVDISSNANTPMDIGKFVFTPSKAGVSASLISFTPTLARVFIPSLPFDATGLTSMTIAYTFTTTNNTYPGAQFTSSYSATWLSTPYIPITNSRAYNGAIVPFTWTAVSLPPADSITITAVDTDTPTSTPAMSKVPIGATVTFTQRVQLIEGVTDVLATFQASTLANKLVEVLYAKVIFPAHISSSVSGATSASWPVSDSNSDSINDRIVIDLDAVTNTPDNIATNDFFTIEFTVKVLNTTGSVTAVTLPVSCVINTNGFLTTNSSSLTVIEPVLTTTAPATVPSGDAGDLLPLSYTISHSGASTAHAFNVIFTIDNLPSTMELLPGSGYTSTATPSSVASFTSSAFSVTFNQFSLGNSPITITLTARVKQNAHPTQKYDVSGYTTWQSTAQATFRKTIGSKVNQSFQMITVPPGASKTSFVATKQYNTFPSTMHIGERITLNATLALIEATFSTVSVTFTMPSSAVFGFDSLQATFVGPNVQATGLAIGSGPASSTANTFTFSYPDLVNNYDNQDTGFDIVVFTGVAYLKNLPAVVDGYSLPISATLASEGTSTTVSVSPALKASVASLSFAASVTPSIGQGGTPLLSTVTLTPASGNTFVYNLVFTLTTPLGLNITSATPNMISSHVPSSVQVGPQQLIITFNVYDLRTGAISFTFSSMTNAALVAPGQSLATSYSATYNSDPDVTNSRDGTFSATTNYKIYNTPQGASQSNFKFLSTQFEHQGAQVANIGEDVTFSGQVALLNATYSTIIINVTMPSLGGITRMDIKSMSLTFLGPGVQGVSPSATPTYVTAVSTTGQIINTAAIFTLNNVMNLPDGYDSGTDVIGFVGVAQVIYVPSDLENNRVLTPIATYSTSVTTQHTWSITQVYTTPTTSLIGSPLASLDAGTVMTFQHTFYPAHGGQNNWYNLNFAIDIPVAASFVSPLVATASKAFNASLSNDTRMIVNFPQHLSVDGNLIFTYNIKLGQDVHPAQNFGIWPVTTTIETAPGSLNSVSFTTNATSGPFIARTYAPNPAFSIAYLNSEYQAQHYSALDINIGEVVNFAVSVPLIHGNYSKLEANVFMAPSSSTDPIFSLESVSVASIGPGIVANPPLSIGMLPSSSSLTLGLTSSSKFTFFNVSNIPDGVYNGDDTIVIQGTARLLNKPSTVGGSPLVISAYLGVESVLPLVAATSSSRQATEISIMSPGSSASIDVSTGQAGTVVMTTVTLKHQSTAGLGFNVSVLITHDAGISLASDLQLSSSVLPISRYEVIDLNNLRVWFDFVPKPSAPGVSLITSFTFASIINETAVPGATYNTQYQVTTNTAPLGTSQVRSVSTSLLPPTTFTMLSAPYLSSQHSFAYGPTQYSHQVAGSVNVGERVAFAGQLALLRGTSPSTSIVINMPQINGVSVMAIDSVQIDHIGASISALGLSVGSGPTSTSTDSNGFITSATFSYNNVVNLPGSDNGDEIIQFTGYAIVRNTPQVAAGTSLSPSATFLPYLTPVTITTSSLSVVEGSVSMSMATNTTNGQAGDVIRSTVTLTPTSESNGNVFNLVVRVTHPTGLVVGDTSRFFSPTLTAQSVTSVDSHTLQITLDSFSYSNGPASFSFDSIIDSVAHPGFTYQSTLSGTYNSSSNSVDDRVGSLSSSSQVTLITRPTGASQPNFAFGNTEYEHIQSRQVNIGEIVQFQGQVALIQATFDLVKIRVTLPTIAGAPLMAIESLAIDHVGAHISGPLLTVGAPATPTLQDIQGRTYQAEFNFVNVLNSPDGVDNGDDVIHYSGLARVLNVPTTVDGTVLQATSDLLPEGTSDSFNSSVTVVEGIAMIAVLASPDVIMAGDNVFTTALITPAAGGSDATVFNLTVDFNMDTPLGFASPLDVRTSVAYSSVSQINDTALSLVFTQLRPNDPAINVTARSVVKVSQTPGHTYHMRVETTYNSSTSSVEARQRKLSGMTQVNIFSSPPGASRPRFSFLTTEFPHNVPSTINIGESVYFEAAVGLVSSTFNTVTLNVSMPVGLMTIEASWVSYIGPSISGSDLALGGNATFNTISSESISKTTFTFHNVVNQPHGGDVGTDIIVIRGIARVLNVPSNVAGTQLVASAVLAPEGTSDFFSSSLLIVEPRLDFSVSASPAQVQAGDSLQSSISIAHIASSNAAAHNLTLTVSLPEEIDFASPLAYSCSVPVESTTLTSPRTLVVKVSNFDYLDPAITFTVNTIPNVNIRPNSTYTTSYTVSSASGTVPSQARIVSSTKTSTVDTFSAPFSVSQPGLEFTSSQYTHDNPSQISIGETIGFKANVALIQATYNDIFITVSISNTPEPLMSIEQAAVSYIGRRISGTSVGTTASSVDSTGSYTRAATFHFTNIVNQPDGGDSGDDIIVVSGIARVLNVPSNVDGSQLQIAAIISPQGSEVSLTSSVNLVEGIIGMVVETNTSTGIAGDRVSTRGTIRQSQSSTASVFNITATLTHTPYLSFVMPLSATVSVPFQVVEASSQKVVLNFPKLERTDAPIDFSVVSKINQIVHPNSVHVSNVTVTYNSSATPIESRVRSLGAASTSIRISAESPLPPTFTVVSTSSAHPGGVSGEVQIGEEITYAGTINLLAYTLDTVTFTVALPTEMTALSAKISGLSAVTGPGISVGASGSLVDTDGDGTLDSISFNLHDVVSSSPNGQIAFEIVSRVLNASSIVSGTPFTVTAKTSGETLQETTMTSSHFLVTPVLSSQLVCSGTSKLEIGQSTFMALTISQDPSSDADAYNIIAHVDLPSGITIDTASVIIQEPWKSRISIASSSASTFRVVIPKMSLNDPPIVIGFTPKLVDASSLPGDLYRLEGFVQFSSSPNPSTARVYAGANGYSINQIDVPAASFDLEYGFPTFSARVAREFSLPNGTVVVGEQLMFHSVISLPSSVSNLQYHLYTPPGFVIDIISSSAAIGTHVTATNDWPTNNPIDEAGVSAVVNFGSVADQRGADRFGAEDQINITVHARITHENLNEDGSTLNFRTTISYNGGATLREEKFLYTLHQPTLLLISNNPSVPVEMEDPIFDPHHRQLSPSELAFDAGDSLVGNCTLTHYAGSIVRAENVTLSMSIHHSLKWVGLTMIRRGVSYDLSDPDNWRLIIEGSDSFPPEVDVKFLRIWLGEVGMDDDIFFSYELSALPSLEIGSNLTMNFKASWSSHIDWEMGRVATRDDGWSLKTSAPYIPTKSAAGPAVSVYKSIASNDDYKPLHGVEKNETAVGDVLVTRYNIYLPEGTYRNTKIFAEFDPHLRVAPLLTSSGLLHPGFTNIRVTAPGVSSIRDILPMFTAAEVDNNKLTLRAPTDWLLTNSPDSHFILVVVDIAALVPDDDSVYRGVILKAPKLTFSWQYGTFTLRGSRSVIVEPTLQQSLLSSIPVVSPGAAFSLRYVLKPELLSNSPAYQVKVELDLGATDALTITQINIGTKRDGQSALVDSPILTKNITSPTTAIITCDDIEEGASAYDISFTLLASTDIPFGTSIEPVAKLSFFSQPPVTDPESGLMPGRRSLLNSLGVITFNQKPQLIPGANRTFYIMEHTFVTFSHKDIFTDPDGYMTNSSAFIVTPALHGDSVAHPENGTYTYTPAYYYNGNDTFVIRICDELQVCSTAMIGVIIFPVVDNPLTQPDSYTTAQLQGYPKCAYPDCSGVYGYPLANDWSPDDVELDPASFRIVGPSLRYGTVSMEVVSSTGVEMRASQPLTSRILYTSKVRQSATVQETTQYEVCDIRGVCSTEAITFTVAGSSLRSIDPRITAAETSAKKCYPSYIYWILSFILGVRGPAQVNLMEYMTDYQQFIAYSRFMTGSNIAPPSNYTDFSDCYQWTIINLPVLGQSVLTDSFISRNTVFMSFYGNHILWTFIGFIVAMAFAYLVLVPIALFLWDRLFWIHQLARTERPWTTKQRLLYGLGTMLRYGIFVYLPVNFWLFYVTRSNPSAHMLVVAFTVAIPGVIFFGWWKGRDKMRKSNVWHAFFYEAFNDFEEQWMWWVMVVLARHLLIAAMVGFIPSKLASVWLVFVIRLVYLAAVIFVRPYTCVYSFTMDIIDQIGAAIGCILFFLVASEKMHANGLIVFHYLVMSVLLIVSAISTVMHLRKWWNSKEADGKHGRKAVHSVSEDPSTEDESNSTELGVVSVVPPTPRGAETPRAPPAARPIEELAAPSPLRALPESDSSDDDSVHSNDPMLRPDDSTSDEENQLDSVSRSSHDDDDENDSDVDDSETEDIEISKLRKAMSILLRKK